MEWHHIVEQNPANLTRFSKGGIHNVKNIVKIPYKIHRQISGFYSSKPVALRGLTVRQYVSRLPLKTQYKFGIQVMRRFGVGMP